MQMTKALASKIVLGGIVIAAAVTATNALAAGTTGGCYKGNCLDVWKPVLCPNGQIYSNDCYAARACQKGCVAAGSI